MITTASRKPGLTLIALLAPFALGLGACNSREKRHEQRLAAPQVHVELSGSTEFFQNRIQAIATLDSLPRHAQGPRQKSEAKSRPKPQTSGKGRGPDQGRAPSGRPSRGNLGSQQPPLALRVTFTNQGSTPLNLSIREINSALGNFGAQPDQAKLAPGESIELEPMISRMGVVSGRIPLEVELRTEGQTESQTIILLEKAPAP